MIHRRYLDAIEENTDRVQRAVLRILTVHVGRDNAITDDEICRMMGKEPVKFERTVRLAIKAWREEHRIPICSESGIGYYLPASRSDATRTANELYSRAARIREAGDAIRSAADELFGAQESLF
jgi:hypothetical protein